MSMKKKKDADASLDKSQQSKEESLEKQLTEACKKLRGSEQGEKGLSEAFRKKVT